MDELVTMRLFAEEAARREQREDTARGIFVEIKQASCVATLDHLRRRTCREVWATALFVQLESVPGARHPSV